MQRAVKAAKAAFSKSLFAVNKSIISLHNKGFEMSGTVRKITVDQRVS